MLSVMDMESRELVDELKQKLVAVERQNNQLKSKLLVAKQQLLAPGKKITAYDHVKSRVNTGITPKRGS